jgi:nucleotide-binding universal stress UspA family protein
MAFDSGFSGGSDADWMITMRQSIEEQLGVAEQTFRQATQGSAEGGVAWLSGIDAPASALADASRAADLIVAGGGPRRHESPYRDIATADLVMEAGRPVLVAPPAAPPLNARKVVVAWKDSREARRALADAMPFLQAAEAVLVLEICEADGVDDARLRTDDVASSLSRRGVAAEARVVVHGHAHVAAAIVDEARLFGADLVVLGCYGHSRLGERVFGGVTRDLLAQDEVYLLLSH